MEGIFNYHEPREKCEKKLFVYFLLRYYCWYYLNFSVFLISKIKE